jgi:hypothetical protein
LAFPPLDWIYWIFLLRLSGIPSTHIIISHTVFRTVFEVEVVVDIAIVIDALHVLLQFTEGRLESHHPVTTELFELVHEPLALVIDQLQEKSSDAALVGQHYGFRLLWPDDVLFGRIGWRWNAFFRNF